MTVLVTGARGNVGRHVVEGLLDAGVKVRAAGRDPRAVRVPAGVEVVAADLADPATLPAALAGVSRVFLYNEPQGVDGFVEAARAAGVAHVVLLSSASVAGPEDNPIARWHLATERPLADSGIPYTFVRPGAFATNTLRWSAQVRTGTVRLPYPGSHSTPIHERDIAAVATRALTGDSLMNAAPLLSGPESLTQERQVELIGEAIGRTLTCEELPPEEARGIVPDVLLAYLAAGDGRPMPVETAVEDITGRPALTYARWARDHAADFA